MDGLRCSVLSILLLLAAMCCGCAPTRNALPERLAAQARIRGLPAEIRDWGDGPSERFQADLVEALGTGRPGRDVTILTVSGGGADGAYAAGMLVGWSDAGSRPEFTIVTGVSTGALLAPFVFAGPQYDDRIREMYTTISDDDLFTIRSPLRIMLGADSLADTTGMRRLLDRWADDELIAAVARAHRSGRRLYIGTTFLDAQRMVAWNMGAIAEVGTPEAKRLFRDILLASASIPVAFPPVYVQVEAEGAMYDEMHTDGGGTTQVFFPGFLVDIAAAARSAGWPAPPEPRLYIIQTVQICGDWRRIRPDLLAIAERMLSAMLTTQGRGDLLRLHHAAVAQNMTVRYAGFPNDFSREGSMIFDPIDMIRLFDLGAARMSKANPWEAAPPTRARGQ